MTTRLNGNDRSRFTITFQDEQDLLDLISSKKMKWNYYILLEEIYNSIRSYLKHVEDLDGNKAKTLLEDVQKLAGEIYND